MRGRGRRRLKEQAALGRLFHARSGRMVGMDDSLHNEPPHTQKSVLQIVLVGIVGLVVTLPVAALVGHLLFGEPLDLVSHLHIAITMGAILAALEWQRQRSQPSQE